MNFDATEFSKMEYELVPAHNGSIKKIIFSSSNNSLYTLGEDGIVLQWSLAGFDNNYSKLYFNPEFIIGQQFQDKIEEHKKILNDKIDQTK